MNQPPEILRLLKRWINWDNIEGRKVPRGAKVNDPQTWRLHKDLGDGAAGIVLGPLLGGAHLVGADFDDCIDEDGVLSDEIQQAVSRLPGYAEISPSGRGLKVYWLTRVDTSAYITRQAGYEFYSRGRYFAVTGRTWADRDQLGPPVGPDWTNDQGEDLVTVLSDLFTRTEKADPDEDWAFPQVLPDWDQDRIRNELMCRLDPDMPYGNWFRVCAGLHLQTQGEGFELFDSWSSGGDKYAGEDECRLKWDSCGPGLGGTTLASVIAMSRDAWQDLGSEDEVRAWGTRVGATPDVPDRVREKTAQDVKEALRRLGVTISIADARILTWPPVTAETAPDWSRDLTFVSDENRWVDGRGVAYNAQSLDAVFRRHLEPGPRGVRPRVADYLNTVALTPTVDSRGFFPLVNAPVAVFQGREYLNSWPRINSMAPDIPAQEVPGVVDIVREHIDWILGDDREAALLWDVLCWIVQHPGERLGFVTTLVGVEGCGKTFFAEMLSSVFGGVSVSTVPVNAMVDGGFNEWIREARVCVLNEIRFSSTRATDNLKHLVTDPTVTVEEKFQGRRVIPNSTNWMAMSNHLDALPIGPDSRRYFILQTKPTSEMVRSNMSNGYFKTLWNTMLSHPGTIRKSMLAHQDWHPDFEVGRSPRTAAFDDMVAATEDEFLDEVRSALKVQGPEFGPTYAQITPLARMVGLRVTSDKVPLGRVRSALVNGMKWKRLPEMWWPNDTEKGVAVRLWVPPQTADLYKKDPDSVVKMIRRVRKEALG